MGHSICPSLKNPKKISVVLRQDIHGQIQEIADWEGRSVSNLCAYWLERAAAQYQANNKIS